MTSMWMAQNNYGKYLDFTDGQEYEFMSKTFGQAFAKLEAEAMANVRSGHLVEMVPAKPKVPVSREEAELIDDIANGTSISPATAIGAYAMDHCTDWSSEEFRLMEAAIDGYTVVEPTKYNVKVPHTTDSYYAKHSATGKLNTWDKYDDAQMRNSSVLFTMAEIKHYGLEDCERVEINTDDSDEA